MKIQELRKMPEKKLKDELNAAYRELFNLRMQRASGQLTKNHMFKETRKTIARIHTLIHEKVAE
jgi:large subunit ribosomal protein L29